MNTELVKRSGLVKVDGGVRRMAARMERARQSFEAKVERAQAEYVEACEQAVAEARGGHFEASPKMTDEPAVAAPA